MSSNMAIAVGLTLSYHYNGLMSRQRPAPMQNPAEQPHIPALPEYERQNGGHASLLAGATADPHCTTCGIAFTPPRLKMPTRPALKEAAARGRKAHTSSSGARAVSSFWNVVSAVYTAFQVSTSFFEVWRGDYFECTTLRELGLDGLDDLDLVALPNNVKQIAIAIWLTVFFNYKRHTYQPAKCGTSHGSASLPPTENACMEDAAPRGTPRIRVFTQNVIASSTPASLPVTSREASPWTPGKTFGKVSQTGAEPAQYAPPIPGQDLDRVYTLTGTGYAKRAVGTAMPRARKRVRRVQRPDRVKHCSRVEAWEPVDARRDDPMSVWLPLKQEFSDELLIRAGLGTEGVFLAGHFGRGCRYSHRGQHSVWVLTEIRQHLVRCESCGISASVWSARGGLMSVTLSITSRCARRRFLAAQFSFRFGPDFVFHIGHNGGRCPYPHPTRNFTVIHTNGVHRIQAAFCDCDRCEGLSKWQQALRDGWYPATTVDPQTFANDRRPGTPSSPQCMRYGQRTDFVTSLEKLTNPCGTEWEEGLATAPLGSAAVLCWACPREGVNLPDDWREVADEDKFLFMLYLALDANFRMRSRLRKKSANKAYTIVESYMEHLKHYVKEDDISTCIAFAALMQKDTKLSTGLRATVLVDMRIWIIYFGLQSWLLICYGALSYDIGCQWKVHLLERKKRLPALLKGDDSPTQEFGPGNVMSLTVVSGTILERRYEVAVEERDDLIAKHDQASSTLTDELKDEWTSLVTLWHEQEDWPDSERTAENPYASKWKKDALKVADVMVAIEKEETEEARNGVALESDVEEDADESGSGGKKKKKKRRNGLEQTQRRIRWLISKRVDLTAAKETKIQEQRTAFFKHLKPFRNLQFKFMPAVEELLEEEEDDRDPDADPVAAENVKLYLPSDVMSVDAASCPARMKTIETQLRRAQCSEALMTLRLRLHAKSHVIKFRNNFVTGQKRGSRARTVIDTISDRVDAIAAKYRQGSRCGSYYELKPEDVSTKFVVDANAKGARRLARIQGRQARQSLQAIDDAAMEAETEAAVLEGEENTGAEQRGSSRRKLSWIWTVAGDLMVTMSICTSSYARTRRWNEEVRLLLEEMRRVLRTLAWTADWWMARAEESSGGTLLDKGRRAYARRQAAWLGQIRTKFAGRWRNVVGTELKDIVD
ncbi:hypothetical protein BDZ89DRAFT_1049788 [Hymenopellis radicata]|nr:hypothetical protein BDZ89DRAFT_1049788 [Hymenopellis radicata]